MSTPTPTPLHLAGLSCVRLDRRGGVTHIEVGTLDDVRALLAWCSMPMTHAGTRRRALDAVLFWIEGRDADLARRELEQTDREAGCVALLKEAAVLVGQAARGG